MTFEAYLNPDFTLDKKIIFLIAAFIGLAVCILFIVIGNSISTAGLPDDIRRGERNTRIHDRVQRFYEMMISATSVMSFACAYVIINHIYSLIQEGASPGRFAPLVDIWANGRDFVLLLLICLSCVLNTLLDRFIIPLKLLGKDEKATIRMLGMFYVIIILLYLNVIGDESEYSPVMMYYLGLMVGRFVYFDASFADFIEALKNCFKNSPLLIMGLALTGALCKFGFSAGYLLERNYYIVGAFYTHVFIIAAIFILHHSHILSLFFRKDAAAEEDYPVDDETIRDRSARGRSARGRSARGKSASNQNPGGRSARGGIASGRRIGREDRQPDYLDDEDDYYDYEEYDNYEEYDGPDYEEADDTSDYDGSDYGEPDYDELDDDFIFDDDR